ncbi:HdeD family acid-resistance protein [Mesorhizobium sp. B2-4-12]|uniref:HdeD family acid-resistance protein n=1 Tax=unclassified Mesorhizobium TaxID=325217 RepID=UPI00112BE45F|nr:MULTISPECIES: HdeD family acid-resistance protein [unclassified Mesorhizobium]TPK82580.1 HdeD family acid-resistance protein [Mesorhizobium sp. B2-4-17]TPK95560.1 HdeD family acid-resistance protein [Mesorhizobium sp. B2-4-12]
MTNAYQASTLPGAFAEARARWGWFLVLGIIFVVLGAIAVSNLLFATIVTVYYVGMLMIVAGVAQIVQSMRVKSWGGFFLWLLSGLLYAVAGVMTFANPLLVSAILTLLLALLTIASGLMRLWLGFQAKSEQGWGWIVASGVVTTIAGLVLVLGWPVNSLWLLGLVLSIDLVFQGLTLIGLSLRLRTAA